MALREKIRGAELDGERIEQDMLFAYAARLFPRRIRAEKSVVEANLMAFIQLHRGAAPKDQQFKTCWAPSRRCPRRTRDEEGAATRAG